MDPTERFADLVAQPAFALDEAALLLSAHAEPGYDTAEGMAELDRLAEALPSGDLDALLVSLFGEHGFAGNPTTYYDARNSYLHEVLRRRRGIPITLSVLLIAVGRRVGLAFEPIGTPAHFMTRVAGDADRYIDSFAGGNVLRRADLDPMFAQLAPGVDLTPYLEPLAPADVLRRMLANLVAVFNRAGDRNGLIWSTQLRTLLPDTTPQDARAHVAALAAGGDFGRAALVLEALVAAGDSSEPDREMAEAERLRAKLN